MTTVWVVTRDAGYDVGTMVVGVFSTPEALTEAGYEMYDADEYVVDHVAPHA